MKAPHLFNYCLDLLFYLLVLLEPHFTIVKSKKLKLEQLFPDSLKRFEESVYFYFLRIFLWFRYSL